MFYVCHFRPRHRADLRLGEIQCLKLSLFFAQLCLGELKMGRDRFANVEGRI